MLWNCHSYDDQVRFSFIALRVLKKNAYQTDLRLEECTIHETNSLMTDFVVLFSFLTEGEQESVQILPTPTSHLLSILSGH